MPPSEPRPRISDERVAEIEATLSGKAAVVRGGEVVIIDVSLVRDFIADLRDARQQVAALTAERDALAQQIESERFVHRSCSPDDPTGVRNAARLKAAWAERDEARAKLEAAERERDGLRRTLDIVLNEGRGRYEP